MGCRRFALKNDIPEGYLVTALQTWQTLTTSGQSRQANQKRLYITTKWLLNVANPREYLHKIFGMLRLAEVSKPIRPQVFISLSEVPGGQKVAGSNPVGPTYKTFL